MNHTFKKTGVFLFFLVIFMLTFFSGIIVYFNFDPISLYINNTGIFLWELIIFSSILFVLPFFIEKKRFNIILGTVLASLLSLNHLLIATSYINLEGFSDIVVSIGLETKLLLLINIIVVLIISLYFGLYRLKRKRVLRNIYGIIVLLFVSYYVVWFIGINLNLNISIIDINGYGLLYQLSTLFRGTLLYFFSIIIISKALIEKVKTDETFLSTRLRLKKVPLLIIWFFLGFFGIERLFISEKKEYFIIQYFTAAITLSFMTLSNHYTFNYHVNIFFLGLVIASALIKIYFWILSFFSILSLDSIEKIRIC